MAALNHPGVLSLHDVGDADGVSFMVTELLEGETLRERLLRGPLPSERVAEWGAAAADALAAAHERGIVHRDLKPENLFLTRDGRLKILDFGLAKELAVAAVEHEAQTLQSPTRTGVVLGTLGYLSPEQARGEPVDARSDLFSLGCVLYECLTGRRAFDGRTAQDLIAAVLRDEPPASAALRPDVPVALARVVERCLAKEKTARFQSASDLAFALRAVGHRGSGAAVAAAPRGGRPSRVRLARRGRARRWRASRRGTRCAARRRHPSRCVVALTGGSSREASPVISTDGKFVAYLASDKGRTDVWVKFVGGGPGVNLTAGSGLEVQSNATIGGPEISPDGSAIAVNAGPPGAPNSERGTWLIPAPLGGPPRLLVRRSGGLRWSADGQRIAYMRPDPASGDAIFVARADGGGRAAAGPGRPWHPRPRARLVGRRRLHLLRPRADEQQPGADRDLARADQGRRGRARRGDPGHSAVPAADAGRARADLRRRPGRRCAQPLVAAARRGERPPAHPWRWRLPRAANVARRPAARVRGADQQRLAPRARPATGRRRPGLELAGWGVEDVSPSIARTGALAFVSARNGTPDIWVSEADGSNPRPLTSDPESDSLPAISPDGSRVAFVSTRGGRRGLWLVATGGGPPSSAGHGRGVLDRASWSADGRRLLYAAEGANHQPGLWIVSAEGGTPTQVPGVSGRCPAWSPASRRDRLLHVDADERGSDVRLTNSRGETRSESVQVSTGAVDALAFSWDGPQLAIGRSPGIGERPDPARRLQQRTSRAVDQPRAVRRPARHRLDARRLAPRLRVRPAREPDHAVRGAGDRTLARRRRSHESGVPWIAVRTPSGRSGFRNHLK